MDMIEVVILLVRDPFSSHTEPNNVIRLLCSRIDSLHCPLVELGML